MLKETLNIRKYKIGYEIRTELWRQNEEDEPTKIKAYYTPEGDYIGDSRIANYIVRKRGIKPEKSRPDHCVCSIGFCERDQKYYGWSHRAMCGFGVGDKLFEERFTDDTFTPFIEHGSVTIQVVDQAKQAAINFAASVS